MNKLILMLCLLLSVESFATKARVSSLGLVAHLTDEQYVFTNPNYTHYLGSFLSYETGLTAVNNTTTSSSNAEGMVGYQWDKNTFVAAIGHQDDYILTSRRIANAFGTTYTGMTNPLHAYLGIKGEGMNHVFGAVYSNFDDKVTSNTESSSILSYGLEMGAWQYYLSYVLVNDVKNGAARFDGNGSYNVGFYYTGEVNHFYGAIFKYIAKSSNAGVEQQSHDATLANVGWVQTHMIDGNNVFWSATLNMNEVKCKVTGGVACTTKLTATTLPVIVGFEAQANEWLALRGAVTQTVLVNQTKDDVGYPVATQLVGANGAVSEFGAAANGTVVSAGAGLKFNKMMIDGFLAGSTNQQFNTANMLTQLSLKYTF